MSRRRGSATALKASEVVEARAMISIYSHIGICQVLFLGWPLFLFGPSKTAILSHQTMLIRALTRCLIGLLLCFFIPRLTLAANSWSGVVFDNSGKAVAGAVVRLHSPGGAHSYETTTSQSGEFHFDAIEVDSYAVSVASAGKTWSMAAAFTIPQGGPVRASLILGADKTTLTIRAEAASQASGGEHLSSTEVSSLPLNQRDFSKLLLLAAGTMTDTNGAANFTQQFAVNGQRGSASVFAVDGADTSDPELGGATFSNFNVDAIQEVQSSSGVMPAEIGHGAAGFTNVVTKSGTNQIHGSAFEFLRNAAFDARNFF